MAGLAALVAFAGCGDDEAPGTLRTGADTLDTVAVDGRGDVFWGAVVVTNAGREAVTLLGADIVETSGSPKLEAAFAAGPRRGVHAFHTGDEGFLRRLGDRIDREAWLPVEGAEVAPRDRRGQLLVFRFAGGPGHFFAAGVRVRYADAAGDEHELLARHGTSWCAPAPCDPPVDDLERVREVAR